MSTTSTAGSGRETRLLLLVIAVAVATLLVLAQFRFPAAESVVVAPASGPIERIAARATFEDLALIIADVSGRVQPSLVAVVLERVPPPAPKGARRPTPLPPEQVETRVAAGLRVSSEMALIHLPDQFQVRPAEGMELAVSDPERQLALVRVPGTSGTVVGLTSPAAMPAGPGYVALAEGGRLGAALRPVFIGRFDLVDDPRWTPPPTAIGGEPHISAGAFVFSLEGRLVGMTIADDLGLLVIPAPALEAAVAALMTAGGGAAPGGNPEE